MAASSSGLSDADHYSEFCKFSYLGGPCGPSQHYTTPDNKLNLIYECIKQPSIISNVWTVQKTAVVVTFQKDSLFCIGVEYFLLILHQPVLEYAQSTETLTEFIGIITVQSVSIQITQLPAKPRLIEELPPWCISRTGCIHDKFNQ